MNMNGNFRKLTLLALSFGLVLTMLLTPTAVFAQAISGNIVGTVSDSSGAVVTNASVEATNLGTGVTTAARTGTTGGYRFDNLPIGTYKITVKASGFRTVSQQAEVELNKTGTVNVTMNPGAATETIEVSGEAPLIDTSTPQVTINYNEREIADSPGVSGNGFGIGVLNLSLYSSGVASNGGVGAGTGPSVGGQRAYNNNFTIEGVDNNNKVVTGPLAVVPNDAVASFSVLQNMYAPDFGHSSGGQFNQVVITGTNGFHGKAYEYFENRNLNAIDQIVANPAIQAGIKPTNPRFDSNRYGGQIGGPIIKNKLFFFFNYERNAIGQSVTPTAPETPTAAGFATLASLAGINQTNFSIFKQYVAPAPAPCGSCNPVTVGGQNIEIGLLPVLGPSFNNFRNSASSVDYNISGHDQLRGRFIYNHTVGSDTTPTLPIFFSFIPATSDVGTLSEYHTFSPTLVNELRIGYNRYKQIIGTGKFTFPGLDQFPNLTFDELSLQVGPDPNAPQFTIINTYQASDNVNWTKGRHTWQFGFEARKYISPQSFTQRSRGDYDYSTLDLYLRDQVPDSLAQRSVGKASYDANQIALYWYVSDTWRVRPNLTLTLGLRHEYTTIPADERLQKLNIAASVPGLIDFSEPRAPKKNFAPRVGLAWSPGNSSNTSVRAGFGMAYDVLYDNIGSLSKPPQLNQTYDCPGAPTCPNGPFLAGGGLPPAPQPFASVADARAATANWVPPNQKDPYSISWTLGVQHTFAKSYTAEVRYLGTRGVHLNVQDRINRITKTSPTLFLPTYLTSPGQAALDSLTTTLALINAQPSFRTDFANAGFRGNLLAFVPFGDSVYHGLAAQLNRRFSNGLQFQAAYTFSHNIDNSTADVFSTLLTPRRPQDFQNLHVDRSSSALDHRHRFTLTTLYDLPVFKGSSSWLMRNVVGNWEFAPVYTYESPEFATVQAARDANGNGDTYGDRAIVNPAGKAGTGTDVTALKNTAGDTVAYVANDPTARYIRTGIGALSNLGRNTLPTEHINNWDFGLYKSVSLTERFKFQMGAQMLNVFNHPQFTPGYVNRADGANTALTAITTSSAVREYLTPGASTFNVARAVFSSNPRTMQLSAKFIF
jgi:carboxypeptidase family protein